jgi:hypothetical protein
VARTPSNKIPSERLEQYERLVATQPGVKRKGASVPYTSVNGHMFSFLSESGLLALRLPAAERERFLERFGTNLHEAYGIVMKEYVTVSPTLLADTQQLAPFFGLSYAHVAGLKPKPTRRAG